MDNGPLRNLIADFRRVCRLVWRIHGLKATPDKLAAKETLRTEMRRRGVAETAILDLEEPYV